MKKNRCLVGVGMILAILSFGCGTTQNAGTNSAKAKGASGSSGTYAWTFENLANVPCKAVINSVKDEWRAEDYKCFD